MKRLCEPFATDRRIHAERELAHERALSSLARYKFYLFGYWAARWVVCNRLHHAKHSNPFQFLVAAARAEQERIRNADTR